VPITKRDSVNATSALFPYRPDDSFVVFDKDSGAQVAIEIDNKDLHLKQYEREDSLTITNGADIHDDVEVLSVWGSTTCASVYGGAITFGDIRRAARLLWPAPAVLPEHPEGSQTPMEQE